MKGKPFRRGELVVSRTGAVSIYVACSTSHSTSTSADIRRHVILPLYGTRYAYAHTGRIRRFVGFLNEEGTIQLVKQKLNDLREGDSNTSR